MKIIHLVFALSVAILLFSRPVFADIEPYYLIKEKADKGDPIAEYKLGKMYESGLGVDLNFNEAVLWFRKSADQGYSPAEVSLGGMYTGGYGGLPKDNIEAQKWYTKAAAQNNPIGKLGLALLDSPTIAKIQSLPQNFRDAIAWVFIILLFTAPIFVLVLIFMVLKKILKKIIVKK